MSATFDDDVIASLKRKAKEEGSRSVAYHEAGHALVGVLLGQELVSVTLEPGETHFEGERYEHLMNNPGDLTPDDREFLLARARIAFAGSAGEAVGRGGAHPLGPDIDLKMAHATLQRIGPRGERPGAQELNLEVQGIVADYAPALHRIASALLIEGTMTAERVRELIAEPQAS